MKKFLIPILLFVCLGFYSMLPTGAGVKQITFPTGYVLDTLINTGFSNRYDADTIYVDFYNYPIGALIDTVVFVLKLDSVDGLYGARASDSIGRSKVLIYSRPYARYPHQLAAPGMSYVINDTIVTSDTTTVTDSSTAYRKYVSYKIRKLSTVMEIVLKHNYADTSAINRQARTAYLGYFDLLKKE